MRSLQFKLTLALLLTSLMSVLLVGLVARRVMLGKFNQNAMNTSLTTFRGQVKGYVTAYGSWEKAQAAQPFRTWVEQHSPRGAATRPAAAPTGPSQNQLPPEASPDAPPPGNGEVGNGPMGGPPNGPPGGSGAAQFRFGVIDAAGHILLGPPEMRGQLAPPDWRASAAPVMVNGRATVSVVPYGEPELSPDDHRNLDAMRDALFRGAAMATLLALALGIGLAHALSRKLRELAAAMRAMGSGQLRQRVAIQSNDEIGELAGAFNRMSEELFQAHEKLQQSHTQISEQAARLEELSIRDGLTQLFNRRHFDTQVAQMFEQAARYHRPLTVMIGDIDHFKKINDTFSHATGDEVLRHVSLILKKLTRNSDIVARYGGEEFVIAFPETPLPQAYALCERLRAQIEAYAWSKIQPALRVTMSMGLCDDLSLNSAEKMVAGADELLYYAKEHGRNRVCAPDAPALALEDGSLLQLPPKTAPLSLTAAESA